MAVFSEMIEALLAIYDGLMQEVVLYGSCARGTETQESDVDIAVILSGRPSKEISDWMIECVASYEPGCGKVLSVIEIERTLFDRWKDILPFYRNIRREGIVL